MIISKETFFYLKELSQLLKDCRNWVELHKNVDDKKRYYDRLVTAIPHEYSDFKIEYFSTDSIVRFINEKYCNSDGEQIKLLLKLEGCKKINRKEYNIMLQALDFRGTIPDEINVIIKKQIMPFFNELPFIIETIKSNFLDIKTLEGRKEFGYNISENFFETTKKKDIVFVQYVENKFKTLEKDEN